MTVYAFVMFNRFDCVFSKKFCRFVLDEMLGTVGIWTLNYSSVKLSILSRLYQLSRPVSLVSWDTEISRVDPKVW